MDGQRKCGIYITQNIIHLKNKEILASTRIWVNLEEMMQAHVMFSPEGGGGGGGERKSPQENPRDILEVLNKFSILVAVMMS